MTAFELHARLAADCIPLGRLVLSRALLMNDARFPWVILVPERAGLREIYELDDGDQVLLMRESCRVARTMAEIFAADKMNVAALGNQVPQLHLHHIVRYHSDAAWPNPVWSSGPAEAYHHDRLSEVLDTLRRGLSLEH